MLKLEDECASLTCVCVLESKPVNSNQSKFSLLIILAKVFMCEKVSVKSGNKSNTIVVMGNINGRDTGLHTSHTAVAEYSKVPSNDCY